MKYFIFISTLAHPKLIFLPLVVGFLLFHHKKLGWIILEAVLAAGFAAVSTHFIKQIFDRPRPFMVLENVNSLDPMAYGTSFPSTHTAFAFAIAFVFVVNSKKPIYKILWFVYAVLIAVSRIWLGVHYPLDVLEGALIGIALGMLSIKFTPKLYKSLTHHRLR